MDKGSSLFLFVPVKPFQPKLVLVIMLNVIMLSVIMLSVIMPSVIIASVNMLSVNMLSVIMSSVVAPSYSSFVRTNNLIRAAIKNDFCL